MPREGRERRTREAGGGGCRGSLEEENRRGERPRVGFPWTEYWLSRREIVLGCVATGPGPIFSIFPFRASLTAGVN